MQVFGIPWDEVHEEAHSFEHGISENLEERMRALLVGVTTCPHGHPIGDAPREPGVPLVTVPVGSTVRVLRHENEAEELLHAYKRAGIEPGDSIEVTGLTGESLELLTPAKGATSLSIPESRAVTVAIEDERRRSGRRGGRARRGRRAAHVLGPLRRLRPTSSPAAPA